MSLSLRSKLLLGFALVAAVPLIAIEQVAARLFRREFETRTARAFEASLRLVQTQFQREGERVTAAMEDAAQSFALRDALLAYAASSEGAAQSELIRTIGRTAAASGLQLLTLYAEDGTVLASAQEPARFDVRDREAVSLFRERPRRPVLAREDGIAVSGLALRVAHPLDEPTGRYWLAGGALLDDAFFERYVPVEESLALLVVSRGELRAAPTGSGRDALGVLARRQAQDRSPAETRQQLVEDRWKVMVVTLAGVETTAGTALLFATSQRPLEEFLRKLEWTLAALLLAGLGVAFGLAFIISRRWTDPIEQLARGLDRVARGDLEWRIDIERDDELGRLVQAFHAMTADLAESREKLLQAERVAAWREIARRLAHEIKNPLSPITLAMETLRRAHASGRADFPVLLAESTAAVLEEVERLRRIVQEFSDFARLPAPRLVDESFHDVVRGVVSLHAGLDERHRFQLDLEPGEGRLVFDPDQMNRLLVNLVKNAIEAAPEGGEIRISTRADRGRGSFVVTVEDSGPGVSVDMARRLFQPYTTSKEGGTGLGLAIAHRIATEHGGDLSLANPGEPRARFRLVLPLGPRGDGGGAAPLT